MTKQAESKNSFSKMEEEVLDFWDQAQTFQKSLDKENPKGDFVFYDGPPFATGLPHYGHLVGSIIKDTVPRYWTMQGYRVDRKWGWDCHGLPLENLAEKELGLKNKQDIEKIGINKFNDYCHSIVLRYAKEWQKTIRRMARWVDMENDYRTMDLDYMESIWWVFKRLWEKDLIYKGYKSMHICPRCGTSLSNFEVGLGYKEIKDISVIARFRLEAEPDTSILAWTTTPWTLVGNVALAVGEKLDYIKFELKNSSKIPDGKYIVSKEYFDKIKQNWTDGEINKKETLLGKDLVGQKYLSLFDYYFKDKTLTNRTNGWQVYPADFVSTEEGTGIVHIAPAFGEDDLNLGKEFDLPFIQHVDQDGKFKSEVVAFAGQTVKPKDDHQVTDIEIIKYLAKHDLLFAKEKYEHSYPHCWRCDTPLLNYATDSWFVKVTKFKEELQANNQKVNWVPNHLKDGRFGKWLEQVRDWAISRDRYWGAPLPVWQCQSCGQIEVVGSREELNRLSGQKINDLHKQFVDQLTFTCGECQGKMARVSEVLDCWFESGSMPYAQFHYPFENKEKFEQNFPAQFVAEGIDQTRGWFYTLMVLSTALFRSEAFKNVITNGIVLAEDGQKMSKSKNNYPDPAFIFDSCSADATRYYLLSSSVVAGENLNFSEEGVRGVLRKTSMTLWNVYKFYSLIAETEKDLEAKPGQTNVLDIWITTRLEELITEVTTNMDNYLLPKATRPIGDFIDDLSTWYLRRSRDRFKGGEEKDKQEALETTKYVLLELSKILAPFMPFLAEQLWQRMTEYNFTDHNQSVHLENWPKAKQINQEVLLKMKQVRDLVELGLAERDKAGIKVRQPLAKMTIKMKDKNLSSDYLDLIAQEVNLKQVELQTGSEVKVELDTQLNPELIQEGIKRELVRLINNLRKNLGLSLADKILLSWQTESQEIKQAILNFKSEIEQETLSQEISQKELLEFDLEKELPVNGSLIKIIIKKIN